MFTIFRNMLRELSEVGLTRRLLRLPVEERAFDPIADGPRIANDRICLCVTGGYDAQHSFFEIDERGLINSP